MVRETARLFESMAAAGLDPKAVKTILISHLHGDHIYGLMNNESNAQVFPDADIVGPAAELKWWTRPGVESLDLGPTRKGLAQRIQARWRPGKTSGPLRENQNSCLACTPFRRPVIAREWSRI
jgi:glyoxylase-like metal-dependent hydrolase (beta-lactamase superfamily II)